jgi:hypothetical protein
MSAQIIPLTPDPNQVFEVPLNINNTVKSLYLTLRYNELAQYWFMTVKNSQGVIILDSIPLVTGNVPSGNILRQFAYLGIGSAYVLNASEVATPDFPNNKNLGTDFVLLWDDTPAA